MMIGVPFRVIREFREPIFLTDRTDYTEKSQEILSLSQFPKSYFKNR